MPLLRAERKYLSEMWGLVSWLLPSSLFYFFFGTSAALYFLILFTSKKKSVFAGPVKPYVPSVLAPKEQGPQPFKRLYLNVYFLDRKEMIYNIIRSKVPRSRPLIRAMAKRAAVALLESGIVEKVGQVLCQTVPDKLAPMGVTNTCSIAYTKKAFLCLELCLISMNVQKTIAYGSSEERAATIKQFLDRYSLPAINDYISKMFLGLVADRLVTLLPAQVKEKMFNKMGAELEIIICSEEEQGPFILQTIQQMENTESSSSPKQEAAPSSSSS